MKPLVEAEGPYEHKFTAKDGNSGDAYTTMGWVNCMYIGGYWNNIWHLSPKNANVPRNPSLYFHGSNRYLLSC